jgi:hypothetical protein
MKTKKRNEKIVHLSTFFYVYISLTHVHSLPHGRSSLVLDSIRFCIAWSIGIGGWFFLFAFLNFESGG